MKLISILILLLPTSILHSQTVKYKFALPKRESHKNDTVAFRPYTFTGNYKNGEISFIIEYEKDFPNAVDYSLINPKANALRQVSFQFEFFDSTAKKILNESTRLEIELLDGHAIAPGTQIFRANYKIPLPHRLKFTWSFFDQENLNTIKETYIWSASFNIDLFACSKDYSTEKSCVNKTWGQTWPRLPSKAP